MSYQSVSYELCSVINIWWIWLDISALLSQNKREFRLREGFNKKYKKDVLPQLWRGGIKQDKKQ